MTFTFFIIFQIVELINVTAKKMSREGNVIVVREDSSVFFQTIQAAACLVGNHFSKSIYLLRVYIITILSLPFMYAFIYT